MTRQADGRDLMSDHSRLARLVFSSLRTMDAEASTQRDGDPTGLSWYGAHAKPTQARPQTEPAWSQRLASLLSAGGYPAVAECRYPGLPSGKRNSCDVVVRTEAGKLWVEVKGAWRDYWSAEKNLWIYRSYLLHPLLPNLDTSKTHTVPLDLEKLARITAEHGSAVGMLLVGFERPDDPMDQDVAELTRLAGLDRWETWVDRWPAAHVPEQTVRCWLWVRPLNDGGT